MADIVKARNVGQNASPVIAPLYDAPIDANWDSIPTFPIANAVKKESVAGAKSILSRLQSGVEYSSIDGITATMVTKIGDDIYRDVVEIVGCTNTAYVVRIDDIEYSVRKSVVRFIKGVN